MDEPFQVDNASLADVQQALTDGRISSTTLTQAYLTRIADFDRAGPSLNSVREVNPDALTIAGLRDGQKPSKRYPLAGIPILVKDNIATADRQHTTAGSLALETARARQDATVVRRLRAAGAVILGKANLTEFANFIAIEMPAGYSSLGGQVKNPYAPALDDKGAPIVPPGGSSSGSAVAVAAGLCAAAIGTETSGSLLSPATQNGLVTVKPTVGLISRAGIVPIAHSQDTAGPLTRTVRDAAILLNVLAARDKLDPPTRCLQRPADYTAVLDEHGLRGARIGLPSDPADPANDVYYGKLNPRSVQVMSEVVETLRAGGAEIVCANIPTVGWIGGPGTRMAVLNRNPQSRTKYDPTYASIVFVYEIKRDLNAYLSDWASETSIRTMADVIAFNDANADRALRFGQDLFLAAAWLGRSICARLRCSVSTPIWTRIGSTRCCSPAAPVPQSRPRQATRAFMCRPGSPLDSMAKTRPIIRSARRSPAVPGANRFCSVSLTPSSRRPRRAVRLPAMPLDPRRSTNHPMLYSDAD